MTTIERLKALLAARDTGGAIAFVEREAARDDVDALYVLAQWRLHGVNGPRDPDQGYALLLRAGAQGMIRATMTAAALRANGSAVDAAPGEARALLAAVAARHPPAADQIALLDAMTTAVPPARRLRDDPYVARIDALLSAAESDYLVRTAEPHLVPSSIIDDRTGRRIADPVRTSDGMSFGPLIEDSVIHAINRRIAAATGTDVEWGEPLHMLRYHPGQQYRRHLDAIPGVRNQRRSTLLIYLNEGFDGGETEFSHDGLRLKGGRGDAILFANVDAAGGVDRRTEHAGLPVVSGTKWLATRWIRERIYNPWDPSTAA